MRSIDSIQNGCRKKQTIYWLALLRDTDYLTEQEYLSVKADCDILYKMLSSITKTLREDLVLRSTPNT